MCTITSAVSKSHFTFMVGKQITTFFCGKMFICFVGMNFMWLSMFYFRWRYTFFSAKKSRREKSRIQKYYSSDYLFVCFCYEYHAHWIIGCCKKLFCCYTFFCWGSLVKYLNIYLSVRFGSRKIEDWRACIIICLLLRILYVYVCPAD